MKPTAFLRSFLLLSGSTLLAISSAQAQLYWDGATPGGAPGGGNGTWDENNLTNWDSSPVGADVVWLNANLDTAVFGGTAGTVTLGEGIDVGGLTFNTTGYTITADSINTLSFSGTSNVLFNNIAAATITGTVGGAGNVSLSTSNPATAGTLTLNGTSTDGWSGTTTINAGMTLALAAENQGLSDTTGITLNGGGAITSTNTSAQASLNRIIDSAGIAVNGGGTFTYTNTATSAIEYAETLGAVTLNSGQFNVVLTNNQSSGGSPTNKQTLTLGSSLNNVSGSGLARTTATSAVTFSAGTTNPNAITNRIAVYGATATTVGQIVGPWATVGTSATAQTDYAIYDASGFVTAAGSSLTSLGQTSWGSTTDAYQFGTAQTLTADRTAAALRYTGGANALALAGFTLKTNGILNGGTGILTVSGLGALTATGTGGGNLFLTTGNNGITVSSKISNNGGAVTVVKSGSNTNALELSGNNDFTGGLVVNAGTVRLTGTQGFTGGVTLNGGAFGDSTNAIASAELNGNSITVNGLASMATTGVGDNITGNVLMGA